MKARVIAVVLLATLSACGSNTTERSGSATKPDATGVPAATGAGAVKSIEVCTVLPVAQAAQLSGQPYTSGHDDAKQTGWTSGCAYNNDDSTAVGVNVNLDTSDRVQETWNLVHTGNISEVSGLGDKAFWDNDNTLYALSGPAIVQVNGLDSKDRSEALAKVVIAALH